MLISDWSSDVCSSDLEPISPATIGFQELLSRLRPSLRAPQHPAWWREERFFLPLANRTGCSVGLLAPCGYGQELRRCVPAMHRVLRVPAAVYLRSEERRVGQECVGTCRLRRYA